MAVVQTMILNGLEDSLCWGNSLAHTFFEIIIPRLPGIQLVAGKKLINYFDLNGSSVHICMNEFLVAGTAIKSGSMNQGKVMD